MSAPLGPHLHPTTKDKIWWGEFLDLFSLLFRKPEPKPWAGFSADSQELNTFKHHKVYHTWDNYLSGYTNFMAGSGQYWKALALIKYVDIMHRVYKSFLGSAC